MAKPKAKAKAKKPAKAETLVMIVGSKVKECVKEEGLMTSSEFLPALNESVRCLIKKAVQRAQDNGRKTVQPRDL